jgi:two-component system response regulator (stage 0 sporulation protein F)
MVMKILIMDDEPGLRRVLVKALAPLGHNLLEASDGDQAIELGRKEIPDIALLDIRVPGRDGLEVLSELKKINPAVIGIMISGFIDDDFLSRLKKLGAFAFLQKPFELETMIQKVQSAISSLSVK